MKIKHLSRPEEFREVISRGRRSRTKHIRLYVRDRSAGDGIYVGTIISKRNIPKAVHRNYLKRVIYSFFEDLSSEPRADNRSYVVRIIHTMKGYSRRERYTAVIGELDKLLSK